MRRVMPSLLAPVFGVVLIAGYPIDSRAEEYRRAYDYVSSHQTNDPYQAAAREYVTATLEELSSNLRLPAHRLLIARIPTALMGDLGVFYTSACSSIVVAGLEPLVLCNEDYLYEIEAAVRANEMSSVYRTPPFYTDQAIFSFVRRVMPNPKERTLAMRALAREHPDANVRGNEKHIQEHLQLALLYFAGHELGHISKQLTSRPLLTRFSRDDPLQTQVDIAVVRMCRHADEFWKEGNGLPGYEWTGDLDQEVRQVERQYFQSRPKFANEDEWYADEIEADEFAARVLAAYLDVHTRESEFKGAQKQYFLLETLHSLGIYAMYRDLTVLGDRICISPLTALTQLGFCLGMNRDQYVRASSIFSDVHRSVFLRTKAAMYALLNGPKDRSALRPEERRMYVTQAEYEELMRSGNREKLALRVWYAQSWQRYLLHDILTDTHVKLAMHGCASGWIMIEGSPHQLFLMTFENMEAAISRLVKFLEGGGKDGAQ